jgi:DNA polymerase V
MKEEKIRKYIAIDLKSFYASAECMRMGYDPLNTNLVVADESRTDKTICLAVSPSLKSFGVGGRPRLFEVKSRQKIINAERRAKAPGKTLTGKSIYGSELNADPSLALDFLIAPPHMADYLKLSAQIFGIYLNYVAPEDIHVYSIDEVFIDATPYLNVRKQTASEFAMEMVKAVLKETGITATAGIGTNLYLCKIAMDIEAKHKQPDENGVRMAELDERKYRELLWDHKPITDFWMIGRGLAKRLRDLNINTMGELARFSLNNEDLLFKRFGVNAELMIDHAWGRESCLMEDIKNYRHKSTSTGSSQVLMRPYAFSEARLIAHEMAEQLALDLLRKHLLAPQIVLGIHYDAINARLEKSDVYAQDYYGRLAPPPAHGSINLDFPTNSAEMIVAAAEELFDAIVEPAFYIRRLSITAANAVYEDTYHEPEEEQLDMFTDYEARDREKEEMENMLMEERAQQEAVLKIQDRYGKNAIFKAADLQEGATTLLRNGQIGGHKAK